MIGRVLLAVACVGMAVAAMGAEVTGPRLTDQELFAALDLARPDLAAVRAAVEAGDLTLAKRELARHLRARTSPRWHFDPHARPRVTLPAGGSGGWDYYSYRLKLDWQGWRRIRLPKQAFAANRQPIGWHWIRSISLKADGWDLQPDPRMDLYLDDLRLVGRGKAHTIADFEAEGPLPAGLERTTDRAHSGRWSGRWRYPHLRPSVSTDDVPRDWRPYDALEFWAWSPRATGGAVMLILDSDRPDTAEADRVLAHNLESVGKRHQFGPQIDWTLNPVNYMEWPWQLNRFPFWVTLGRAYWDTGDERYAREFTAQMTDWVRTQPLPEPYVRSKAVTWRTIELGIRLAGSWMHAWHLFITSPSFDDEAAVTMLKSFAEQARFLVKYPTTNNWLAMECNGLFHVGVMFPEFREAAEWRRTALDRAYAELDRQVYADGAQVELSTGYHQVSLGNFLRLAELAALNDVPLPADYIAKLERMYHYNAYLSMPGGVLPPLNDAGYTDIRRGLLEALRYFPARADWEYIATDGAGGTRPAVTSCEFPYAGHLVMRSGWGEEARYLMLDAGPFGAGHQHEDKLSIVLAADGRRHLVEGGVYPYDSSPWRRYVLSTRAHNTVLVDGLEQNRRAGDRALFTVKEPLPHAWVSEPDLDYAAAAYDEAYGPDQAHPATHRRHVLFVKPDYWLVVDELRSLDGKPHRYDSLFHLDTPEVTAGADPLHLVTANQEGPNLALWAAGSAPVTVQVVAGQQEPVVQGWVPSGGYDVRPIPTPIFTATAPGTVWLAYLLYPLPAGQAMPAAGLTLSATEGGCVVEVRFADGRVDALSLGAPGGKAPALGAVQPAGEVLFTRLAADGKVRSAVTIEGEQVRRGR